MRTLAPADHPPSWMQAMSHPPLVLQVVRPEGLSQEGQK